MITRRSLLITGGAGLLAGCDTITRSPSGKSILGSGEDTHQFLQRSILGRDSLAREFRADQLSPRFRVNGSKTAETPEYATHAATGFRDWRLKVDGLVRQPLALSLDQLRAMPQRAQITRHDCVEGWSAIGKWQGPHLARLLDLAGLMPQAKFIVFHCADLYRGAPYYESIDLIDAYHPQTIMAWAMNDRPLETGHGAPVRLRVERQLGYKHAKFVMRVEAVASLAGLYGGKGGYWEDSNGYQWYAGI